jgi:hypothetical protein
VLSKSSREDKWQAMGRLVGDDVLNAFAVVAEPGDLAGEIRRRYGALVDRVSFYTTYEIDTEVWEPVVQALNSPSIEFKSTD